MWPNPQLETADFVTFTEEILNKKLQFLCSEKLQYWYVIQPFWRSAYELSGCRFECRYSHLNFIYHVCFEQEVDIQASIESGVTLKCERDMIRRCSNGNRVTLSVLWKQAYVWVWVIWLDSLPVTVTGAEIY